MIDIQKWFFYNDKWYSHDNFEVLIPQKLNRIYEVFRIVNAIPLFLEDHYARFGQSLMQLSITNPINYLSLKKVISDLIIKNDILIYNARFELIIEQNKAAFALYLIPFTYPTKEQQSEGVRLATFKIQRKNPHIKQSSVNNSVRNRIKDIIELENVFEVLLVDYNGNITEGSRSNVFFVKDNCLYSPPSEQLLEGITRKKVIHIARKLGLKENYEHIPVSEIKQFQACFITGTSLKILPVCSIGGGEFDVNNKIIRTLTTEFNKLINNYCSF